MRVGSMQARSVYPLSFRVRVGSYLSVTLSKPTEVRISSATHIIHLLFLSSHFILLSLSFFRRLAVTNRPVFQRQQWYTSLFILISCHKLEEQFF